MTRLMTSAELEGEIGALAGLPRSDLVERWRTFYRPAPPKCTSRRLLVGAIAYAMQAKNYGGLKPAVRRQLRKVAHDDANGQKIDVVTLVTGVADLGDIALVGQKRLWRLPAQRPKHITADMRPHRQSRANPFLE